MDESTFQSASRENSPVQQADALCTEDKAQENSSVQQTDAPHTRKNGRGAGWALAVAIVLFTAAAALFLLMRIDSWNGQRREFDLLQLAPEGTVFIQEAEQEFVILEDTQMVDARCAQYLQSMLRDCRTAGFNPVITDSYISRTDQQLRYDSAVFYYTCQGIDAVTAEKIVSHTILPPGRSEHELGLAVDIMNAMQTPGVYDINADLAGTWLRKHCHEYGFILRYPEGCSDITGLEYVPYHYRFVGLTVAQQITEMGITLEEYVDLFYSEQ